MNANQPMLLPPSIAKPDIDIVRRFLAWAQSADADARAEGASALARAYLHSDLPEPVRAELRGRPVREAWSIDPS